MLGNHTETRASAIVGGAHSRVDARVGRESSRRACGSGAVRIKPNYREAIYSARTADPARCLLWKIEQTNGARFEYLRIIGQSRVAAVVREDRSAHAFPIGPYCH